MNVEFVAVFFVWKGAANEESEYHWKNVGRAQRLYQENRQHYLDVPWRPSEESERIYRYTTRKTLWHHYQDMSRKLWSTTMPKNRRWRSCGNGTGLLPISPTSTSWSSRPTLTRPIPYIMISTILIILGVVWFCVGSINNFMLVWKATRTANRCFAIW